MPANIRCPVGHKLMVPSRYAGRSIACPRCGVTFVVPAFESPATSEDIAKPTAEKRVAKSIEPPATKKVVLSKSEPIAADNVPPITSSSRGKEQPLLSVAHEPVAESSSELSAADSHLPDQIAEMPNSPPARGMQHPPHRIRAMYYLGAAIASVAVFDMIPAFFDVVDYFRTGGTVPVSAWALALLFLGMLQCVYAVYVAQLPDWSTARVATIMVMALAMFYAMLLGSLMVGTEQSWIVQRLQLTDRLRNARLWCFLMLSLTGLIAYFAGRITVRWRQAERASFST